MEQFNIYYLNFSKVYDINMLLCNVQIEEITTETQNFTKTRNNMGMKKDMISLNHQKEYGEYTKFTEKLKVKHEKSVLIKNLIPLCEKTEDITTVDSGTLVLIKDVKIEFYDDEETQRTYSLFQKRIFEGINIEGMDFNNLISTVISDMSYLMKCKLNKETIVFKIPMENKSEFENKYTINDLLIGNLTIIGIYKGKINEKDFKRTTVSSALENEENTTENINIIESSYETRKAMPVASNTEHFIDIFTIIQPINKKEIKKMKKKSLLTKIKNILLGE